MHQLLRRVGKTLLFLLWLAGSIYLGGIFVSVKETLGINVFSSTGFSSFKSCLIQETRKGAQEKFAPSFSPPPS